MQLVAYGAQDIYLTGNPQITFWKVSYKRHTNFSMESIEQTFNGAADWGRKVTCTISRNGDLIYRVYLQVTLPRVTVSGTQQFRWLNWLGHVMIRIVEVEIGGQRIDRQYGDWMHIWNELTQASGKQAGYASMVGNVPRLVQPISGTSSTVIAPANAQQANLNVNNFAFGDCDTTACMPETVLFIPLEFWFCRNPGLALPLIALQYHEVKINMEFREAAGCYWYQAGSGATSFTLPSLKAASLYVDYVYLDTDERRRFAQTSHEYLIEQLQYTGAESVNSSSNKIKLNFNHPVKELVWVVQPDSNVSIVDTQNVGGPQWFNYTDALDMTPFTGTPGSPYGEGLYGPGNPMTAGAMNQALYTTVGGNVAIVDQGVGIGNTQAEVNTANANFVTNSQLGAFSVANSANTVLATAMNIGLASANYLLDRGNNPTAEAKLQLNGHDRFSARDGRYFNLVQPYQHHTNCPKIGINVYSFGLKPEEHQPSGTCNMSRIDNATLLLQLTPRSVQNARSCQVRVYATNYNVLRIMSGMGGLNLSIIAIYLFVLYTVNQGLKAACHSYVSSNYGKPFMFSRSNYCY